MVPTLFRGQPHPMVHGLWSRKPKTIFGCLIRLKEVQPTARRFLTFELLNILFRNPT